MLFTDGTFWILFSVVLVSAFVNATYLQSVSFQNATLLLFSYIFYAAWDWRFLSLIVTCSIQTYVFASAIRTRPNHKALLMWSSISLNLIILGIFKYANFFASELATLLAYPGLQTNISTLNIILPVGISFYVFQSIGFVVDTYHGRVIKHPPLLNYFTFVAFFPQLVAGPIERASNLLPQFSRVQHVNWENIWNGVKLIIFGLFLKAVIADSLAPRVDDIYANFRTLDGGVLCLGTLYFSAQIYGDFCGYSTIAIGVAKIIGINLMTNFDTPYLATSLQDFWRRWHISLSSFFRDYVYIPMGGSRCGPQRKFTNLAVTFGASGLWHGASWSFVVWGLLHGVTLWATRFVPANLLHKSESKWHCVFQKTVGWFFTIFAVGNLWVFFRTEGIGSGLDFLGRMYGQIALPVSHRSGLPYVVLLVLVDLLWRGNTRLEQPLSRWPMFEDILLAIMLLVSATVIMLTTNRDFIYFQF